MMKHIDTQAAVDLEAQKVKVFRLAKEAEALATQLMIKASELREELERERHRS